MLYLHARKELIRNLLTNTQSSQRIGRIVDKMGKIVSALSSLLMKRQEVKVTYDYYPCNVCGYQN